MALSIEEITEGLECLADSDSPTIERGMARRIRIALRKMRSVKKTSSAEYLHVWLDRSRPAKPYRVSASEDGKTRLLGNFETFDEARDASDAFEASRGGRMNRRHSKRDPVTGRLIASNDATVI